MNKPDGSTSALLEDPNELAKPDQQQQGQAPEVKQEKETQQTEDDKEDQGKPPSKTETPKSSDKVKPTDAPAEDPVQAAIARLRNDGPKVEESKTAKAHPPKDGDAEPTNGDEAEPKTSDEDDDAQPRTDDLSNPLNGWTTQELKHTKGTVKQRFRDMHAKVQDMEPYAVTGKGWTEMIQSQHLKPDIETLDDDQIAWSLRAQGAAVRAVQAAARGVTPAAKDLEVIEQLRAGIAEVDKAIGRRATPADPNALAEAFTGSISEDLKDAAEIAGLSEKEVRLIAALRSHKPAPVTPPPATRPAPTQQPTQRAPEAPARDTQPNADDQFFARKTNSAIQKATGLKAEQTAAFFDQHLTPILGRTLQRDYPGQDPRAAFSKLGPAARHQMVADCLAEHQAAKRPTPPPTAPSGRAPLRAGGESPGSPGGFVDPIKAAIERLRSD